MSSELASDLPVSGSDLELMAYYDGELPTARRLAVEARLRLEAPDGGMELRQLRAYGVVTELVRADQERLHLEVDQARWRRQRDHRRRRAVGASLVGVLAAAAAAILWVQAPARPMVAHRTSLDVAQFQAPPAESATGRTFAEASVAASASAGPNVEELEVHQNASVIYAPAGLLNAPPVVWILGSEPGEKK